MAKEILSEKAIDVNKINNELNYYTAYICAELDNLENESKYVDDLKRFLYHPRVQSILHLRDKWAEKFVLLK